MIKKNNNPQCHISLAKCEWIYRKAFFEEPFDMVSTDEASDEREILILLLLRGDLRFIDLFISPAYILDKLNTIDFTYPEVPDIDGNGRLGKYKVSENVFANEYDHMVMKSLTVNPNLSDLADHLYNTAKKYENTIPNRIWLLSHSMGGMFMLRYLTADPEETRIRKYANGAEETDTIRLYEYYKEYTYEEFLEDIKDINGTRYPFLQDIIDEMENDTVYWSHVPATVDDKPALQALYEILKRERENNVPKAILQDGPFGGSHVAEYAFTNFEPLRRILKDETEWIKWKAAVIAGCVTNIALSCVEIALGVHLCLDGNPIAYQVGKRFIMQGMLNTLIDTAIIVLISTTTMVDSPIVDFAGNPYLDENGNQIIDKALKNPLFSEKPVHLLPSFLEEYHINNGILDFDVSDVDLMQDLRLDSEFISTYKSKPPPTYITPDGSIENIEIHNIIVSGVESICGGGARLDSIPIELAIGFIQFNMLTKLIRYLVEYTDPAMHVPILGLFEIFSSYSPLTFPIGTDLPEIGLFIQSFGIIFGLFSGYWTYITEDIFSKENATEIETFIGLMYDLFNIWHEPGAGLFSQRDATGLYPGQEVNPIIGNENAYVYNIDVTTQYQKTSQNLIGNTDPDRWQWEEEVDTYNYFDCYDECERPNILYCDVYHPYLFSHGWSLNTIFRPLSAIVEHEGEWKDDKNGTFLFFNDYLYYDIDNDGPHNYDTEYGDVSQVTRKITSLKNDNPGEIQIPNWDYLSTNQLRGRYDRNLYYHLMFGNHGTRTPNNIIVSEDTRFGGSPLLTRSTSSRVDMGLTPMMYDPAEGEGIGALEYMQFTYPVGVMPFDIYQYYDSLNFTYSINGSEFTPPTHISEIQDFDTLQAYGEFMTNQVNDVSSVVYNDNGQALLVSPHFKEGYNLVIFQFTDPAGRKFEKDINIIQNTVPLFIKPAFPLMNQYIGSPYVTGAVQVLDITDTGTGSIIKREDWFETADYTIIIDGQPVSYFTLDPVNFIINFDLPYLEDGNHVIAVTANYDGNENSVGWRFWVDTTPPEILFPQNMLFSNKNEQNTGVLTAFVKDRVPYIYGSLNKDVDTVLLSSLKMSVTDNSAQLDQVMNETTIRLGPHSRNWNGWVSNSPLSHGIYQLEVEATDRVGNSRIEQADVILDNQGPVFTSLSINNTLINTNTDLLEITCSVGLDSWEDRATIEVHIENISANEEFDFLYSSEADTEQNIMLSYFTEGENVFKDGVYTITITGIDELGNRSDPVLFEGIVVDRTKPRIENAYITPFLLEAGDTDIEIYFDLSESDDCIDNQSGNLPGTIELIDCYGNILDSSLHTGSFIPDSDTQYSLLTVPATLIDGKYFLNIKITDKNENTRNELVPFVKNAINPEITYPEEGAFIDGIITIKGNVIDPRFNNELPFYRYELYYKEGIVEIPENLNLLTDWQTTGISTPVYQQTEGWTTNCGQFPVEDGDVLGFFDTGFISTDGNVTVLLVVEEEQGYRIGITQRFFYLPGSIIDYTVDLTVDSMFTINTTTCFFSTEEDAVSVPYSVVHDINNPVNINAFVKETSTGNIIKRIEYIDLKSHEIKGVPVIASIDKGIFIYQDETDERFYVVLKNSDEASASFFALISTNLPMTSFVDETGTPISTPDFLLNDGKKCMLSKFLEPGETYTIGFMVDPADEMTITGTIDQGQLVFYLGGNRQEETSGTIVIFPGTNYPLVRWDGKDEFGRYVVNGLFILGIEAFGKLGGYDNEEINLDVSTPITLTWSEDDISNRTFHPGVPQLDKSVCSVQMIVSKGAVIDAFVQEQNTKGFIKTLTPQPSSLDTMGVFILSWEGINSDNLVVPGGTYEFIVTATPHDGSPAVTVTVNNIVVDTSVNINSSITAILDPFEGTGKYNNIPVVEGDTNYHVEIRPQGAYLPDRTADITIQAQDGTKVVEAYPHMNYMAGFRTNYTELWARVKLTEAKIRLAYKYWTGLYWDYDYYLYDVTFDSNNEYDGMVINYNSSTNQIYSGGIFKQNQNLTGTVTAPGFHEKEVFIEIVFGLGYWETHTYRYCGATMVVGFQGEVVRGTEYMQTNPYVSGGYKNSDPAIDPYSGDQTVQANIRFSSLNWYAKPATASYPNQDTFTRSEYFTLADGFAVMGPDVPETQTVNYLKHTPFVHKGGDGSYTLPDFITDPSTDTGMSALTSDGGGGEFSTVIWRKNRKYYFYYVSEKYPDQIGDDSFTRFSPINSGSGPYHTQSPSLRILNDQYHASGVHRYGPFTESFTEQIFNAEGTNGDVVFTLTKVGDGQFSITAESLAQDNILYYYPARVTREAFIESHDVGTSESDTIPPARINGERNNFLNAQLPAYHVNISQVLFPDEPRPDVTSSPIFEYAFNNISNTWSYEGELDLSPLISGDAVPSPDILEVTVLTWEISSIISPSLTFPGLQGMTIDTEDIYSDTIIIFPEEMPVSPAAGIDTSWTLLIDSNIEGDTLKGPRTSLDFTAFNRQGELPIDYISSYYNPENSFIDIPESMYSYDTEQTLIDNDAVIIHQDILDGNYNIEPVALDGSTYGALNVTYIHYAGKGEKINDYFILEKTNENLKKLVPVKGEGYGTISVAYLDHDGLWKPISLNNPNQDPGVITYWDVSGLNGLYTVRLVSEDTNNEVNVAFSNVYIGNVVNTTDTGSSTNEQEIITSPGGEAALILPENSLLEDTVISVDMVELEEIQDVAVLPEIAPIGKIVNLQPDGLSFNDVDEVSRPQVHFTFHKSELDQVDPLKLNIYQLKENGELEVLPTIKQTFDSSDNPIWSSNDDPAGNNFIDDYQYLRAWTVLSHFSYYMIIEGEAPKNPVITTDGFKTRDSMINIEGEGEPGELLKIYITSNPFFDSSEHTPVMLSGSQVVEPDSTFILSDVPLLYEGENYIYIGYAETASTMFAKLVITKDTTPPSITSTITDPFISPDNNGIKDSLIVTLLSDEDGTVKIQLTDINNGQPLSEKQIQVISELQQSVEIDGSDYTGLQIPDGMYELKITSNDALDNIKEYSDITVVIDREAPFVELSNITSAISPGNQDNAFDTVYATIALSETGTVSAWIGDYKNNKIKKICEETFLDGESIEVNWNGTDKDLLYVDDGEYYITVEASDRAGNSRETSFTSLPVKVDNTPPGIRLEIDDSIAIIVPSENIFTLRLSEESSVDIKILDQLDQVVYALSETGTAGMNTFTWNAAETLIDGIYEITIGAQDALNNISTYVCQVEITHDYMPPVLIIPGTITAEATDILTPVDPGEAMATDDSPPITISNNAPSAFPLGSTSVTWSASDKYGNTATGTQIITIVDTTPPVLSIPDVIVVEATAQQMVIDIGQVTATDIFTFTITNNAPGYYEIGTTEVLWTATDENGNSSYAVHYITVQDTIQPVLTIPADITVEANAVESTVSIGDAGATDIFPVTITNNAPVTYTLGTTEVIWTATDENGNTTSAVQSITIIDTTPPVLTIPTDITVISTGLYTPVDIGNASATDIFNLTISNNALIEYPLGTTIVTWTATDENSNSVSADQSVTVIDEIPPFISLTGILPGSDYTDSVIPVISLTDNESGIAIQAIILNGISFISGTPVTARGTHTLTATATDHAGNTTTVTADFSVYWTTGVSVTAMQCEYSDNTYVEASLISHNDPVPGKTIEISINGNLVGTAVTDENGITRNEPVISLPSGIYPVVAHFVQDDTDFYRASESITDITVNPEKAGIEYTGDYIIQYPGTFTLKTQVTEESDGSPGTIENCSVYFSVYRVESDGTLTFINSYTAVCDVLGSATTVQVIPVGVYSIDIGLHDDDYYSADSIHATGVIYNPEDGSANGGGWFEAQEPEQGNNNKANFGFNVKYKNGEPEGNLNFHSKPDDIDLKGKQINWLVINEGYTQFQGTGTIKNLAGDFTFRITCTDAGNSDTISITIWQGTNTDAEPVYEALNQPLGGGNIKVKATQ